MPEVAIGSRITIKEAIADPSIDDCTTLVLETSRGTRLTLDKDDSEGEYELHSLFTVSQGWRVVENEEGEPVTLTLSPTRDTPLPADLFGVGWLRFVGPSATVIAKVFG